MSTDSDAKRDSSSTSTWLRWRERLWWFDVVYPIALALLLFGSLTAVVYSGQRQMRLAMEGEYRLLQTSLRQARHRPPSNPGPILLVSASALDIPRLGPSPRHDGLDLDAVVYSHLIEHLSAARIEDIVIALNPNHHPRATDYWDPLVETIATHAGRTRVTIAIPMGSNNLLPESLRARATIVEDSSCDDPDRLQTQCSYDRSWNDWIIQSVINRLGEARRPTNETPTWVNRQLASGFPSYILNLSPAELLPQIDAKAVLRGAQVPEAKMAFVGVDDTRAVAISDPTGLRRVLTVYDSESESIEVSGTPLHVFWAQIGQMYVDRAMIYVPPGSVTLAITVVFCLLIVSVLLTFGGPAALGMFVVYVAAGPLANALALRYLQIYVPLFDSFYFGLATLVVASFAKLSIEAFKRWRYDEQLRMHTETADLKGNFISLLSHNLNTPVAKMQGMLSLLANLPVDQHTKSDLTAAESLVAQLEYSIRAVLIASALEEGSTHDVPRNTITIRRDFLDTTSAALKRLQIELDCPDPLMTSEDPDDLYVPLAFDTRALNAVIAGSASMFHDPDMRTPVLVDFAATTDDQDQTHLSIKIHCERRWLPASVISNLARSEAQPVRSLAGQSFFLDMQSGLVRQFAAAYGGHVRLTPTGKGGTIHLTLFPHA